MSDFETRLFINGQFEAGEGSLEKAFEPATGRKLADVASASETQIDRAAEAADAARHGFALTTPKERAAALNAIADKVEDNAELAATESVNAGKPLRFVVGGELANVADVFRFFASAIRNMPATSAGHYRSASMMSVMRRDPVGVIAQIVPWNYPLLMAAWKIAPAVAAGNTMVIKPSEHTPLSLLKLAEIIGDILPPGVVNVVLGNGLEVGQKLIAHDIVRMISLTGDVRTGRTVLEAAAGPMIKRTHLELGGKAPVIVADDADLEKLVTTLREASFYNAGQDCTAACRILVDRSRADELKERLIAMIGDLSFGAPERDDVEFGPVITARHRDHIAGFVERARTDGGTVLAGGKAPGGVGYFFEPTLVEAPAEAEIVRKEVFGPVISLTSVADDTEALAIANASEYGLASSVWSKDSARAARIAGALEYGVTWINTHGVFATEMPHGGMKNSGYGSDLSMQSLIDYTQVRHVMTALD